MEARERRPRPRRPLSIGYAACGSLEGLRLNITGLARDADGTRGSAPAPQEKIDFDSI